MRPLAIVLFLALAACGKKPAAKAPAAPAAEPASTTQDSGGPVKSEAPNTESAPGGGGGSKRSGDPCEGGQ
jgi:hypothetical protein